MGVEEIQHQPVALGAGFGVSFQEGPELPQRQQNGQCVRLRQPELLAHRALAHGLVAGIDQGQIAQQRRLAAAGIAQHDQPPVLSQRLFDADRHRLGGCLARPKAVALARRQRRLLGQPALLGADGALLCRPQSDVDVVEFNVD